MASSLGLVYTPDHRAKALERLLSQYRGQPRIESLVGALSAGGQAFEDEAFDLLLSRTLERSNGALLDQWGALVGEQRGSLGDADFRRFIQARILVNRSAGTPDELIAIFRLITDATTVRYFLQPPASFSLQCSRPVFLDDAVRNRVRLMMGDAKPGGVGMDLIEGLDGAFGFTPSGGSFGSSPFARLI